MNNIRAVAAFSLEMQSYEMYNRALQRPYQETMTSIARGNFWLALAFSISNLVYAPAYWCRSRQITSGLYSQTQFFIVLPAVLFSTQSCGQMFALAPDISKARVASSNIVNLFTTQSAEEEVSPGSSQILQLPSVLAEEKTKDIEARTEVATPWPGRLPVETGVGALLRNVYFTYPSRPKRLIFQNLSLDSLPGRGWALVGPSGSGKSTIFSMLERFYRPISGSVVIGGRVITKHVGTDFRDDIASFRRRTSCSKAAWRSTSLSGGARADAARDRGRVPDGQHPRRDYRAAGRVRDNVLSRWEAVFGRASTAAVDRAGAGSAATHAAIRRVDECAGRGV